MITKDNSVEFLLETALQKTCPDITVTKKEQGYQLEYKKKNMKFILLLDEYQDIVRQNKVHIFNKVFKKNGLDILDCTGGFARDACIISSLGNKVTLIEQSPIIMIMLKDAIDNVHNHEIKKIFKNISIKFGNCLDYIRQTNKNYDYIYFDFMFNITKSALPNKREQFLRKIIINNITINKNIIKETIQRMNCKIIIKEHAKSNDYEDLNITNTYKEKVVKYNLIDARK